jgi:hypothetical protein
MRNTSTPKPSRKPVADIVHQILEAGRTTRAAGPSSGLFSRDAQVSGALTQAGTLLAKLDRGVPPPKRSSLLQNLWGSPAPKKPRRRSWLFGTSMVAPEMPDTTRIEHLLRLTAAGGRRLVLDREITEGPLANGDVDCTLPEGATDPVCTPR